MTIQAIDTYYAGHYFRSRLEARWACVFNDLGIAWEYEPQGYRVGEEGRPYLPDFHLTDLDWWVEVKGARERLDMSLLADAVHPTKGLGGRGSTNLMILGPIPDTNGACPLHFTISRATHCGELHRCSDACDFPPVLYGLHSFMAAADLEHLGADMSQIRPGDLEAWMRWGAIPIPIGRPQLTVPKGDLTKAVVHPRIKPGPHLEAAYTLGRTARFEHGEAA
ncbi:hypothetical protein ACF1AL_14680 [Streptomyces sp. NPDC014801]|uniref:hypothetical protein n=1 Tax=Streptomyces sp. NPDC014801 TaxID=3364916 RepID=UPI0036F881B4